MTIEAIEYITSILTSNAAITDEVGEEIYWELGEEEAVYPFLVFEVSDEGFVTKNGIFNYNVSLTLLTRGEKPLTEAVSRGARIREAVVNSSKLRYQGSKPGYNDPEAKEAFIKMDFKLTF